MNKEFVKITKKYTREQFLNNYALQMFLNNKYHLIFKSGKCVMDCPYNRKCELTNSDCENCWLEFIRQAKFKDEI